jgi:hypothetical protein
MRAERSRFWHVECVISCISLRWFNSRQSAHFFGLAIFSNIWSREMLKNLNLIRVSRKTFLASTRCIFKVNAPPAKKSVWSRDWTHGKNCTYLRSPRAKSVTARPSCKFKPRSTGLSMNDLSSYERSVTGLLNSDVPRISQGAVFRNLFAGLAAAHVLQPFTKTPVRHTPPSRGCPLRLHFTISTRQTRNSIQTRQYPNSNSPRLRKYKGIRSSIRRVQCNPRWSW